MGAVTVASRIILLALSVLPACTGAVEARRSLAQLHHTSWTARDGAPVDAVAIAQTDDGFLWFGTSSGLVRFDGAEFERYKPAPGETIPAASIRSLLALPGNGLLVGWLIGGATLLRDGHVTTFGTSDGYPPGTTYQFLRDGAGIVWAATSSGLARYDGQRWQHIGKEWNVLGQRAQSLFRGRDDTLWLFTDKTLMSLPKGGRSFVGTGGTTTTRMPIAQTPDGALYLSDGRGIRAVTSLREYEVADRRILVNTPTDRDDRPVIADRDGGLWFSTPIGLGRLARPREDAATAEYFSKADGLTDKGVLNVFEDRQGSIWVTTYGGVDQFRMSTFVPPTGPLAGAYPAMLPGPDGGLWFARLDSSLQRLSSTGTVSSVEELFATCAYRDPHGVDWYGSQPRAPAVAELVRREGERVQRIALPADIPPEVDIQAITMDGAGALWVSVVRNGVYKFANNAWTQPSELPGGGKQPSIVLMTDAVGRVWLGFPDSRIVSWERGVTHEFSTAQGLHVGNVMVLHEKGRHLWVGGDNGLTLLESSRLVSMQTTDPTVLHGIGGVIERNNGDLWIHSMAGAVWIAAAEIRRAIDQPGYRMSFRLFDDDDGLYGMRTDIRPLPTIVEGDDGRLWFGTNRGVFALDPERIVTNETPPTVVIKQLTSGAGRYMAQTAAELPPHSSAVEVAYTATHLAIARRARFQYRLDGVDATWQDAGARREAFYTNLGPGRYRFHVKASNENGIWSTATSVDFSILPAWYQANWFKAFCLVVGAAVLVLMYRMRFRQVRNQLQGRLQERMLERERIARELHDTLLQGFQGLVLLFGATIQRVPPEHPTRELMSKALMRANEVLAEARDRVSGLRNSLDIPDDLPRALDQAARDLLQLQPAQFAMSVLGTPRPLHLVVLEEVYQIAREALVNAQRHASASKIQLEITFSPRKLRVCIRDNGKGIEPEVLEHRGIPGHWGLSGMRERARKIGAKLSIRAEPGAGTEIELQVPAAVAFRREP